MADARLNNQPILTPEQLASRLGEFYRAVDQYNAGWYFESHETLEDLWMVTPLPERTFFQGIIQLAAAFVHLARREYPGILKLLDASRDKLDSFSPQQFNIDVGALVAQIDTCRAELEAHGERDFLAWSEEGRPRIERTR